MDSLLVIYDFSIPVSSTYLEHSDQLTVMKSPPVWYEIFHIHEFSSETWNNMYSELKFKSLGKDYFRKRMWFDLSQMVPFNPLWAAIRLPEITISYKTFRQIIRFLITSISFISDSCDHCELRENHILMTTHFWVLGIPEISAKH